MNDKAEVVTESSVTSSYTKTNKSEIENMNQTEMKNDVAYIIEEINDINNALPSESRFPESEIQIQSRKRDLVASNMSHDVKELHEKYSSSELCEFRELLKEEVTVDDWNVLDSFLDLMSFSDARPVPHIENPF